MAFGEPQTQITPRETVEHEWRVDEFRMQSEHATMLKRLELELARENHQAEIKLKELELKISSLLRIPILILKLPLFILLGIAYIVSVISKKENPKRFWDLLS